MRTGNRALGSLRTPPPPLYCHHILRRPHHRAAQGAGQRPWEGGSGLCPPAGGDSPSRAVPGVAAGTVPKPCSRRWCHPEAGRGGSGWALDATPVLTKAAALLPPSPRPVPAGPGDSVGATLGQHVSGEGHFPREMHPAGQPALSNALARTLRPLHVLRCKIKHLLHAWCFFFFSFFFPLSDYTPGCLG